MKAMKAMTAPANPEDESKIHQQFLLVMPASNPTPNPAISIGNQITRGIALRLTL